MEMQFTGKINTALKMDDTTFFISNLQRIRTDESINKSILSLCLEHNAFKCFRYLATNGFNELYILSYGSALRLGRQDILDIIEEFKLFDINSNKAKSLLNLAINNNDQLLFDKIKDKITPSHDVLAYALSGKNMEAMTIYQNKGFQWVIDEPEKNPLIYIFEIYQTNKKNFIKTVLESSQKEEMLIYARNYFETQSLSKEFEKMLPKDIAKNIS